MFSPYPRYRFVLLFLMLLQLWSCAPTGNPLQQKQQAEDLRQQADLAISENRFSDGVKLLKKALANSPNAEDYLLLGELQTRLQEHRAARSSYQKGLKLEPTQKTEQDLYFLWATLEALEFDDQDRANELSNQLPAGSAAATNIQVLQAIKNRHFDTALHLTEQVIAQSEDFEMKGWAYFHAARVWVAVGNKSKAYEALFFAINHARGHGLVNSITLFWEDLKFSDKPE